MAYELWLAFRVLVSIFVVAGRVVFMSERAVGCALEQIMRVEEPTRVTSFGM